ncbi:hypothetical protein PoB_000449300 [Plakobranchus ocellatus]|uniref:Uncharacterized protein n=1 Tax=Plakobranchus ocellatus TaxID=259542 RepID=A0AAV3Y606_9GAST|nr:hypothetical protein PoB_000449300 [Plakobranchus ocellatus]
MCNISAKSVKRIKNPGQATKAQNFKSQISQNGTEWRYHNCTLWRRYGVITCSGLIKNWYMSTSVARAVNHNSNPFLHSVTLKYLESGHTYLSCSSFLGLVVKNMRKRGFIYNFNDLVSILETAGAASESVADDLAAKEIGTVDKRETAVYSTATVQDNRPTSIAVGSAACIFLGCVFALLVILDVGSLGSHLSVMRRNLGHRFRFMKKKVYRPKT